MFIVFVEQFKRFFWFLSQNAFTTGFRYLLHYSRRYG